MSSSKDRGAQCIKEMKGDIVEYIESKDLNINELQLILIL